jgi:hypothetical protein
LPPSVQMDALEAGALCEQLESPQHVTRLERCPDFRGEDQAVAPPHGARRGSFLRLSDPVCSECVDGRAGERHGSARLGRLGLAELQSLGGSDERPADAQHSFVEVEVRPVQGKWSPVRRPGESKPGELTTSFVVFSRARRIAPQESPRGSAAGEVLRRDLVAR